MRVLRRANERLPKVQETSVNRLVPPVRPGYDHLLGTPSAPISLVEYGSYACPHCRAVHEGIDDGWDQFGERMRYVFRHRPVADNDVARRAAELVERAETPEQFWKAHIELDDALERAHGEDLRADARRTWRECRGREQRRRKRRAAPVERVEADEASARASGVQLTPTFFINGRRYEALGMKARWPTRCSARLGIASGSAAFEFVRWGPSAGYPAAAGDRRGAGAQQLAARLGLRGVLVEHWGIHSGANVCSAFAAPLGQPRPPVGFFFVVGLEIKREFTVGHLATFRSGRFRYRRARRHRPACGHLCVRSRPRRPWGTDGVSRSAPTPHSRSR